MDGSEGGGDTRRAGAYLSTNLPILLELLQDSDVRELELREGELCLRFHRLSTGDAEAVVLSGETLAEVETAPASVRVTSPLVGTFYRAPGAGTPPLVAEGSRVEDDTVVGIVEALNVLTEVEAGISGVVTEVLASDGQPVQYGQALFEVSVHD